MIGRLNCPVLDCCALLGATVVRDEPDWVTIRDADGRLVSFQRSPNYQPPRYPDPQASQQIHFDVMVDEAERAVLAIGATRLAGEGDDYRVFADPVGHPFCLVWRT
jgi:hypothetical protein